MPNPTPATTVPAAASTAIPPAAATRVIRVPAASSSAAGASSRSAGRRRARNEATAPVAHSRLTTIPPTRWLCRPNSSAATDGPRDRYSPPSAQDANSTGTTTMTWARSRGGMPTLGRSEASAPGRRAEDSRSASTTTPDSTMPASSTT